AVTGRFVWAGDEKKTHVHTRKMEKSFATAEPTTRRGADQAITSIKAGDYGAAVASLHQMAATAKLTPEQEQSVKDVIAQLKNKLTDQVKQAGDDAKKGLGDLQKSVSK